MPWYVTSVLHVKCAHVPSRLCWNWMLTSKLRNPKCSSLSADFIQSSRRSKLIIVCNIGWGCFWQFYLSFFCLQAACQCWPPCSAGVLLSELPQPLPIFCAHLFRMPKDSLHCTVGVEFEARYRLLLRLHCEFLSQFLAVSTCFNCAPFFSGMIFCVVPIMFGVSLDTSLLALPFPCLHSGRLPSTILLQLSLFRFGHFTQPFQAILKQLD